MGSRRPARRRGQTCTDALTVIVGAVPKDLEHLLQLHLKLQTPWAIAGGGVTVAGMMMIPGRGPAGARYTKCRQLHEVNFELNPRAVQHRDCRRVRVRVAPHCYDVTVLLPFRRV